MANQAQSFSYSPRITGTELPKEGRPILITNYKVVDRGNRDYEISLNGIKDPFVQTDWLRQNGTITQAMVNLLGAPTNTHVSTVDPKYSEGLRTLRWDFRLRERPLLYSGREPWYRYSLRGSLLGSKAEGGGRLRIPDVDYFVQPEAALRGEDLWETQLYAQENNLTNFTAGDVNSVARFVRPEDPDKHWLESEMERFRRNGESLKERQIKELYKQLRADIWENYWIRSREVLAWPVTPAPEEDFVNFRVRKADYVSVKELAEERGITVTELR